MPDEPVVCITTRIQNGKLEMRYCSEYVLQLKITRFFALPVQTCFFCYLHINTMLPILSMKGP